MGMLDNRLSVSEPINIKSKEEQSKVVENETKRQKNSKEKWNYAKREKKKNITIDSDEMIDPDYRSSMSEKDAEEMKILEDLMDDDADKERTKIKKIKNKTSIFFLLMLCGYMVFLIYGVFVTNFSYDQKGEIEAVKMSVSDITEKNEFLVVENLYMNMRGLYEEILTLDYRVTQEEPINVATDYSGKADECVRMATAINGTEITADYRQIVSLIDQCVEYIMWNYCTYMSQAITANDAVLEKEALSARQEIENYFNQITENMITLSKEIKGYDNTDLVSWDAEKYVDEELHGIKEN